MVSVDLQSARRKRSVSGDVMAEGFELRFSNDEQNFGDIVNVVIYDEQCFTCNATSLKCDPVVDIFKIEKMFVILTNSCREFFVLLLAIIMISNIIIISFNSLILFHSN